MECGHSRSSHVKFYFYILIIDEIFFVTVLRTVTYFAINEHSVYTFGDCASREIDAFDYMLELTTWIFLDVAQYSFS